MRFSIRTKLILAIGAPLLLVYLGMLWILIDQVRARGMRQLQQTAQENASNMAGRIGDRLRLAALAADDLAIFASGLREGADREIESAARAVAERDALIHEIVVLLPGAATQPNPPLIRVPGKTAPGDPHASSPPPPDSAGESNHAWMDAPLRSGQAVWTEPWADPAQGGARIASYVAPILEDGTASGLVRVDFLLATLRREVGSLPRAQEDFTIVSRQGRLLVRPAEAGQGPDDLAALAESRGRPELAAGVAHILEGGTGVVQAEGLLKPGRRWIAFAPIPSTGWSYIESVPESVVLAFSRSQQHLGMAILGAGLVLILSLVVFMASRITRPLATLAGAVGKLGTGDLDTRVRGIDTRDEIGALAAAFNRMVTDLKDHVEALGRETAAREKMESEIRVARQIQTALLPQRIPQGDGFELHAVNLPARRVAGDFYDCFLREDGTLIFLIADVSGKGVPAALFMAVARTVLREVLASGDSLAAAVKLANDRLEKDSPGSMYVTLFVARYDIARGTLRYVNGGHPAPYRLDSTGRATPFGEVSGTMVGLLPARDYEEGSGSLEPGDRLVLFTDGVPEATDPGGEFFGEARFEALLAEGKDDDPAALCRRVSEKLDGFQQGTRYDDLTLVVLGRRT